MLYLPRGAKSGQENGDGTTFRRVPKVWGKAAGEVRKLGGYGSGEDRRRGQASGEKRKASLR